MFYRISSHIRRVIVAGQASCSCSWPELALEIFSSSRGTGVDGRPLG